MMKLLLLSIILFKLTLNKTNLMTLLLLMFFLFIPFLYQSLNQMVLLNKVLMYDQLSSVLIILTLWITFLMILASNKIFIYHMKESKKNFVLMVISLSIILTISFSVQNFISFYIMFETALLPTLFMILGWGYQPERLQAGMYLILYTITASLPLLMSIMILYKNNGQLFFFSSLNLTQINYPSSILWWMMTTMAFMVKLPLYTLHLWLPKAHVEAPVAGSMILAGLLLKLGGYGFLRISFLYPYMAYSLAPFMNSLALWGGVLTSFICIRQTDIKALIAYSSISHMALMFMGVSFMSQWGWFGALMIMVAHGLTSSCLFALANMTYETTKTRSLFMTKGLLSLFPTMSMWWFIASMSNMAGPPSLNLLSEISLMLSSVWVSLMIIFPLSLMIFMAAAYSLLLYTSSNHGSKSTYSNTIMMFSFQTHSLMLMHLAPIFMLIMKPELLNI